MGKKENKIIAKLRLLVIDDEDNMCHMLSTLLSKNGYIVDTASHGLEGLEKIDKTQYDFILCDINMPKMDGIEFLKAANNRLEKTSVIMMSAYGTIDSAVDAMKNGAYDYISKPFKSDEVLLSLKKAEERETLRRENLQLKEQIKNIEGNYNFGNMIAKSKEMQSIFKLSAKVALYDTTILISGESGTGKELIARGIHFSGKRSEKPLIPVNCGSIPENLIESELFGYIKGAFTGADKNKKGLFEAADKGTIFLDEVGELPLTMQVKLLRVLQENEIRPVGDSKSREIDVRVIGATSLDLEEEVKKGNFREDLFYRLNVLSIKLPPLRDRTEDIPLLCNLFIDRFNNKLEKNIQGISSKALSLLIEHYWPGNVRELENAMERAVLLADESMLLPDNFPPELGVKSYDVDDNDIFNLHSLRVAKEILEKKLITKVLIKTAGNRTKASKLLEISHPSLLSKIKAYNIKE